MSSRSYRIHLAGVSNNETFRIKLLERPLNENTKVFVEGFYITSNNLVSTEGIICIRSSNLQDTNDYDTRTERPSRVLLKFPINVVNNMVSFSDPCLCTYGGGIKINDLSVLHGSIDIALTRENGDLIGLNNGSLWSLDLLFIEPEL